MLEITNSRWLIVCTIGILFLVALSCATGGAPSKPDAPMTLDELFASKNIPSACGTVHEWEGVPVTILGYVDSDNIFDQRKYPDLPYEKFRVIDRKGRSIEVWVDASDSRPFFSRVYRKINSQLIISGRLAAVEMPVKGNCMLTAKVWIDDPSQIQ